ncbi:hypothetical protein DOS77_11880 [Staphylococcus felis]|uniref:hypothetical protein n=1 Tax=Staphylococcus felis TaxID=46127 RepID=UPI000E279BBB|nr:hypothetical protein [Staphylococcus felis]REH78480.1 hypothetical protein DOS57_04725 [Staphylococcus felis]REH95129.1 hypothetical protein DOS67_07940 [Staphylococcus felis]REI11770.1 hypothetical protein DOS66_03585 [Staphylococcus felis]REI19612.1 hypothetical protein DOS77_11880 [Staphylococcus felis]
MIKKIIRKITSIFQKLSHKNLLIIEVKDENSVPEIVYKGKKLKHKMNVKLYWDTRTDIKTGGYDVGIEHYVKGTNHRPGKIEKVGFKSVFRD